MGLLPGRPNSSNRNLSVWRSSLSPVFTRVIRRWGNLPCRLPVNRNGHRQFTLPQARNFLFAAHLIFNGIGILTGEAPPRPYDESA